MLYYSLITQTSYLLSVIAKIGVHNKLSKFQWFMPRAFIFISHWFDCLCSQLQVNCGWFQTSGWAHVCSPSTFSLTSSHPGHELWVNHRRTEGQAKISSPFKASFHFMTTKIPMSKASHMTKPNIKWAEKYPPPF